MWKKTLADLCISVVCTYGQCAGDAEFLLPIAEHHVKAAGEVEEHEEARRKHNALASHHHLADSMKCVSDIGLRNQ